MKYLITTCILINAFLVLALTADSQNLKYDDLKYLLEHDIESADNYITAKGFKFHEAEKGKNGSCDAMIWSFDRDIDNNEALSFVVKHCYKASIGIVWYQLGDKNTFDKLRNYCKSAGFNLKSSEINSSNDLCTKFDNHKYTIEFCSGLNKSTNKNQYTVTLAIK